MYQKAIRRCQKEFQLSADYDRITYLEKRLLSTRKAVENIEKLLNKSALLFPQLISKQEEVASVLPLKIAELDEISREIEILQNRTPSFGRYVKVVKQLENFYSKVGLFVAEEKSMNGISSGGRTRHKRGKVFENRAELVLREYLVPHLSSMHKVDSDDLLILRNVRIGTSSLLRGTTAEIDCLICIRGDLPENTIKVNARGSWCKVLAVVEVKRNADDVGDVFCRYQRTLTWLCGEKVNTFCCCDVDRYLGWIRPRALDVKVVS